MVQSRQYVDSVAHEDAVSGSHSDRQWLDLPVSMRVPGSSMTGRMVRFLPEEAIVRSSASLTDGSPIELEFKSSTLHGQVLYSIPDNDAYQIHIHLVEHDDQGLRKSPRFHVEIPALLWLGASDDSLSATVLDVSCDGLGLSIATPLMIGETIAIDWESQMGVGVVKHCRKQSENNYAAGVELYHVMARTRKRKPSSPISRFFHFLLNTNF